MKFILFLLPCVLLVQSTHAQTAPAQNAQPATLNYEFFRDKVQPILVAKRPGHARCVECHDAQAPRLQEPSGGPYSGWSDDQSRKNFDQWKNFVVPGNPTASRMLMHPLAQSGGGDPFHAGGKHWQSQTDPEWQTLAAWVNTGKSSATSGASAMLDFNYYRKNIEPIFLKARRADEGTGNACASCHTRVASRLRLQPLIEGAWSMENSRANFQAVSALVTPGDPDRSRLLLHPLAPAAGGDPTHTGGKFWQSKDNPEWQTISNWVKGAKE